MRATLIYCNVCEMCKHLASIIVLGICCMQMAILSLNFKRNILPLGNLFFVLIQKNSPFLWLQAYLELCGHPFGTSQQLLDFLHWIIRQAFLVSRIHLIHVLHSCPAFLPIGDPKQLTSFPIPPFYLPNIPVGRVKLRAGVV